MLTRPDAQSDTAHAGATDVIRARLGEREPRLAIILGSGLGALVERLEDSISIAYAELPGFPLPTVGGHSGNVVAGRLEGVELLAFAGRFHLYEGHSPAITVLPVRVAHALGIRTLLVSNAAGGIRRTFRSGDLMLIRDHLNFTWRNPLAGPVRNGDLRFPDMSQPYDSELLGIMRSAALDVGVPLVEGVYAGVSGPSYETPAEVRMLERLGADAVGMSTVPEVIAARAAGMRVAGLSCITNAAAGLGGRPLDHAEILAATARMADLFQRVVGRFARGLG